MKAATARSSLRSSQAPLLAWRRFLVPIDFSPRSRLAVRYAGALARKAGAAVDLLFVIEPAPFYSGLEHTPLTLDTGELARTAEQRLRRLAATLLPAGVAARTFIRQGKAAAEIVAQGRDQGADLIIISTHGYSGLERALMGSTAEQVVRQAPCPVLTLRLEARAGGVRRGAAHGPELRRLLAPVDFSAPSKRALDLAGELAGRFHARLTVLHVVFAVPPPRRLAAYGRRLTAAALEEGRRELAALVRRRLGGRPKVDAEVVAGIPHEQIVRLAERGKADLIVIATRGQTGLKRWLMGSTAEQVIRRAPCPVLVVRQASR